MYPETSTHQAELRKEHQEALALPRSDERDKILSLIRRLQSAEKERNAYYERIEVALQTGRIKDAFGYNILIRATPHNAHVVINHDTNAVIGNFDDEYDANIWARENLSRQNWSVVPLSPTE